MNIRNPIVVTILIGLAIILGVAAFTFLKPEPEPVVHSATYGYYEQEYGVGELQLTLVSAGTYQFQGDFDMNTTAGEVNPRFDGQVEDFKNSVPRSTSFSKSYSDFSLPWPTSVDTRIFVDVTIQMTFLLPPERWAPIHMGYTTQFTRALFYVDLPDVIVNMTAVGKEDIVAPCGTFENCFVLNGTEPQIGLEMTVWVTEQGVVPQAQITMTVRGLDHLSLTMKLEHYE